MKKQDVLIINTTDEMKYISFTSLVFSSKHVEKLFKCKKVKQPHVPRHAIDSLFIFE